MIESLSNDLPFLFRFVVDVIAGLGILLIGYGVVAERTGETFGPLERIAETVAAIVTLVGTALTAASVWFEGASTPPEKFSQHFTAPALIACCAAALVLLFRGRRLSPTILNGFAILAIAAALFRLQPNPYIKQPTHDQARSEARSAAAKE